MIPGVQNISSTRALPDSPCRYSWQPRLALGAGHLGGRPRDEVPDVGAMRGLGIPRVAEHVAVGVEGMHVAFPGVSVHVDMLSHPSP